MSEGGLRELFISVEDFLVRSPEILEYLAPLDSNIGSVAVQASLCPDDGRALLVVVFERARQPDLERLAETLGEVGLQCFELGSLSAPERDHFQRVELARYTVRVESADTLRAALAELARRASNDELHPQVVEDDWPCGTPAEVKQPLQLKPRKAPTAELGELADALDAHFPPIEDDELDDANPGGYSQVRRKSRTASLLPARMPTGSLEPSYEPPIRPVAEGVERTLRVRFLRGERWLPGRIRYVSNREARIATAAPLRLGDAAIVGVSFEGDELFITGIVSSVEGVEPDNDRSPGFTIAFGRLSLDKKARLVDLLKKARDAGVSLRPPPHRRAPRFPVSWPVVVNIDHRPQRATALDISWSGLYLDADAAVGSEILFALPLDIEAGAIRGRAVVVRAVDARLASEFQTSPGIGVAITHLGPGDNERFRAFLDRVKLRCQRRVVVGAAPIRAQGLSRALAAAGYVVTSSTDASALAELAGREPRPPDIAIIDQSLGNDASPTLMDVFRSRNVPTLAIRGEQSESARRVVDRMLDVESDDE